jgi:hypothetical protein
VSRHAAHLEVVRALRHEETDQSFALHLQRQRTVELERGRQQHGGSHCFPEQLLHGGWIVLVLAKARPLIRQAYRVSADRMPLEDESPDEVGIGHGTTDQPANFFFSSSLSCAGFALPAVAFMT